MASKNFKREGGFFDWNFEGVGVTQLRISTAWRGHSRGGRRQKLWQLEITELLTFLYVVGKLSRTDYRSGIKIDQTGFSIHAWPCR